MSIRTLVCLASTVIIALGAGEAPAHAQTTPTVFTFCYMPNVGAVYRIGTPDTPEACRSPKHVEFSWTDGVPGHDHGLLNGLSDDDHPEYVREGETAAGDLSGTYPGPTVQALQGHGVAAVAPTEGQVLAFGGGAWTPTTPAASGIGFADVLALDGAGSGLDADLLDGQDGSAFAAASHAHSEYLQRAGGSMSGALAMGGNGITGLAPATAPGEAVRFEQAVKVGDPAGGDLSGGYPTPSVAGLRGNALSTAPPTHGQTLTWNATSSMWEPQTPPSGGTGLDCTACVETDELADGAVTSVKIADGGVLAADLGSGVVRGGLGGHVAAGTISGFNLAPGAVELSHIATGAVRDNHIWPGTVTTSHLAAGAVTGAKLASGAVTDASIASGAVRATHVQDGSLTTRDIGVASGTLSVDFAFFDPFTCRTSSHHPVGLDANDVVVVTRGSELPSSFATVAIQRDGASSFEIRMCNTSGGFFDPGPISFHYVVFEVPG